MNWVLDIALVLLALALAAGLIRVLLGPTDADRMLGAQLLGTTGIGLLLLLAERTQRPGLADAAIVLALLAAVAAIAFTRQAHACAPEREAPDPVRPLPESAAVGARPSRRAWP